MFTVPTAKLRGLAAVLAIVLISAPHAGAQVLYGSLTGNVVDASGGFMPGTTVRVVRDETGVSKTAVTDGRGVFLFSDLVPGVYTVSFEISGFKTCLLYTSDAADE